MMTPGLSYFTGSLHIMANAAVLPNPEPQAPHSLGRGMSARQADIHRDILSIAKHQFARFGYERTSLTDIARAIDLSPAELQLHFDDKLGLLTAVFDEGWTSINARLQDIVIASVNARQATLSVLAVMMNILERDEDFARLLLFESRRPNPETGGIMTSRGHRWFMRLCAELVVRGQKDGSFNKAYNPRIIVSILTGAMENLMRDRLLADNEGGTTPFTGAQLISAFDALVSYIKPVT